MIVYRRNVLEKLIGYFKKYEMIKNKKNGNNKSRNQDQDHEEDEDDSTRNEQYGLIHSLSYPATTTSLLGIMEKVGFK